MSGSRHDGGEFTPTETIREYLEGVGELVQRFGPYSPKVESYTLGFRELPDYDVCRRILRGMRTAWERFQEEGLHEDGSSVREPFIPRDPDLESYLSNFSSFPGDRDPEL